MDVVLGAGGPTGFECVRRLIETTEGPVRAVVRDPAKYEAQFKEAAQAAGVSAEHPGMQQLHASMQACP
jgi:uncharacterized protein YbjT (DUF2867 family)